MCWRVLCVVLVCVFHVFARFLCDVVCDAVWFVVFAYFVCVGVLFIYLCDAFMINGVLLFGVVLC